MSRLVGELLGGHAVMWAPVVALVIFIAVFALAVTGVWRKGRAAYEAERKLPLEDDHV